MERFKKILTQASVSIFVSAGILSIANIDTIWREQEHASDYASEQVGIKRALIERLSKHADTTTTAAAVKAGKTDLLAALRESLGGVELGTVNPFAQLKDLKPLEAILAKGVVHFKRQSFRSPRYQEENGYDIVSFEIEHKDQTKSTLLAYLERPLEGPDVVPVVLLVNNGPEMAKQALFRGGVLTERQSVPLSVAQTMVSQRLNAGVPFLSVAR